MITIRRVYHVPYGGCGVFIYYSYKIKSLACKLDRTRPATKTRIETCYISGLTQIDIGASPPGGYTYIIQALLHLSTLNENKCCQLAVNLL